MKHPVIRRTESHFTGERDRLLFRRAWLPDEPERVVALVHGFAEHSGRYDHVGAWFAARETAVHAFDHQGHGRSLGPRCHVSDFAHLLDDVEIFLRRVRAEHPGLPLTLIGHSMGGLVVAALACERDPDVSGIVLSAPALEPPQELSGAKRAALSLLGRALPRLRLQSSIDPSGLSRDPEVVRGYVEDPLVPSQLTLSLAAAMFGSMQRTSAAGHSIERRLLVLHGEDDPICSVEATKRFASAVPEGLSQARFYPQLRHEIFNEPERESVFEDVLGWIRAGEI